MLIKTGKKGWWYEMLSNYRTVTRWIHSAKPCRARQVGVVNYRYAGGGFTLFVSKRELQCWRICRVQVVPALRCSVWMHVEPAASCSDFLPQRCASAGAAAGGCSGCVAALHCSSRAHEEQGSLPEFECGTAGSRSDVALTPAVALVFSDAWWRERQVRCPRGDVDCRTEAARSCTQQARQEARKQQAVGNPQLPQRL